MTQTIRIMNCTFRIKHRDKRIQQEYIKCFRNYLCKCLGSVHVTAHPPIHKKVQFDSRTTRHETIRHKEWLREQTVLNGALILCQWEETKTKCIISFSSMFKCFQKLWKQKNRESVVSVCKSSREVQYSMSGVLQLHETTSYTKIIIIIM